MDLRPSLDKDISLVDFKEFYWLKEELVIFCREEDLSARGNKIQITDRIIHFLKTGEKRKTISIKTHSKFNWTSEILQLNTPITDSYSNTKNVRRFFEAQIGPQFRFNVQFMNWMKSNEGKTLKEAIEEWHIIREKEKNRTAPKKIDKQFEYNTYLRDFLADNPSLDRKRGIALWNIKKKMRGPHIYTKSDLTLIDTNAS